MRLRRPPDRWTLLVVSAVLVIVSAFLIVLAACSGTSTETVGGAVSTVRAAPQPEPRCGWYTPMIGKAYGQVVTVAVAGPACRSQALIKWIALESGLPWASTSIAPGTLIAQVAKGGTTVRIWQEGFAGVTDRTAGYLADDFGAAGWRAQQPACPASGCGPTPDITYTTWPAGSTPSP
jgi:hypothetical protein